MSMRMNVPKIVRLQQSEIGRMRCLHAFNKFELLKCKFVNTN